MCSSHKLLLGLVFMTTLTSSLGVRRSRDAERHRQRRPSVVDVRRRATFDAAVASPPSSSRRLFAAPDRLSSEYRDAEMSPLLDDLRQYTAAKRRWNSGNLRVWGKRSSPALSRYVGGGREEDGDPVGREPIWLLPATAIDGERAPAVAAGEWTESRPPPRLSATSWTGRSQLRESVGRQKQPVDDAP